MCLHQEPNFEGNFEIRCAGNAFPFLSEVRMPRSQKKLSFIGPVSILVWALCPKCPVVMRYCPRVIM